LARAAGARRFVFNWALQQWRAYYGVHHRSPTRAELCRALTELKHSPGREWMLDISSSVMQQAIVDVWRAYRSFFAGRSGYPRFKSKKRDRPASATRPELASPTMRSSSLASAGFASGTRAR
jgi:putative transposase